MKETDTSRQSPVLLSFTVRGGIPVQSTNRSRGTRCVTLLMPPTRGFLRAGVHAGPLPILSDSWQDSSSYSSYEIYRRSLGLLHTGLSRTDNPVSRVAFRAASNNMYNQNGSPRTMQIKKNSVELCIKLKASKYSPEVSTVAKREQEQE